MWQRQSGGNAFSALLRGSGDNTYVVLVLLHATVQFLAPHSLSGLHKLIHKLEGNLYVYYMQLRSLHIRLCYHLIQASARSIYRENFLNSSFLLSIHSHNVRHAKRTAFCSLSARNHQAYVGVFIAKHFTIFALKIFVENYHVTQ